MNPYWFPPICRADRGRTTTPPVAGAQFFNFILSILRKIVKRILAKCTFIGKLGR
jgi:hypothetical protein